MTTLLTYANAKGQNIHIYHKDRFDGLCADLEGKPFAFRCNLRERFYANGQPTGSCDGLPPDVVAKLEAGDQRTAVTLTAERAEVIRNFLAKAKQDAENALLAAVPGLREVETAYTAWYNNNAAHDESFERSMSDEMLDGIGITSMDESLAIKLSDLRAKYPRASLYIDAKHQYENAHWADNSGKGARGQRAMQLLAAGAAIEEAQDAMVAPARTEWYAN